MFDKYGDVGDIYIPTERGTGRSRGFAFVRYYDKRDAEVNLFYSLFGKKACFITNVLSGEANIV